MSDTKIMFLMLTMMCAGLAFGAFFHDAPVFSIVMWSCSTFINAAWYKYIVD